MEEINPVITVIAYRESTPYDRDYGYDYIPSDLIISTFKNKQSVIEYVSDHDSKVRFKGEKDGLSGLTYSYDILLNGVGSDRYCGYIDCVYPDHDFSLEEETLLDELYFEINIQSKNKFLKLKEEERIKKEKQKQQEKELKLLAKLQEKYKDGV